MEGIIGIIGGFIFYFSWVVQIYETRKNKKPTFTPKFFIIRIVASIILLIEAIRIKSIGFFIVYLGTIFMMGYNLWKIKEQTEFIYKRYYQ
jgi:lipid-A-disaccharide synthase-like uncharacterized protein